MPRSTFYAWFCASSALLGLAFIVFRYLPMVDLPQHAAQIGIWLHWHDQAFRAAELLELNFRTPYLLAYPIARALAGTIGVVPALQVVVWLAIVGNVLALSQLARQLGHDPALALLGFPAALGYSFYFGFVSFLLATPLVIVCLTQSLAFAERPGPKRGALLSALLCATVLAHGFAFLITVACVVPLLWASRGPRVWRLSPLVAPALVVLLWLEPATQLASNPDVWAPTPSRLLTLPATLTSLSEKDALGVLGGACLLCAVLLQVGRPRLSASRLAPLLVVLGGFALFPVRFHDVCLLSGRFAGFLLPALLIACAPRSGTRVGRSRWLVTRLSAGFAFAWCCLFVVRLAAFNREAETFHAFAEGIPGGLRMRSVIFDRNCRAFPDVPAFLHYSAYYQAEKGGTQGYSFALGRGSVVRYRPGVSIGAAGPEWAPEAFDARSELSQYDYFVVRSERDRSSELFGNVGQPMVLAAHVGPWWGYRRAGLATAE